MINNKKIAIGILSSLLINSTFAQPGEGGGDHQLDMAFSGSSLKVSIGVRPEAVAATQQQAATKSTAAQTEEQQKDSK